MVLPALPASSKPISNQQTASFSFLAAGNLRLEMEVKKKETKWLALLLYTYILRDKLCRLSACCIRTYYALVYAIITGLVCCYWDPHLIAGMSPGVIHSCCCCCFSIRTEKLISDGRKRRNRNRKRQQQRQRCYGRLKGGAAAICDLHDMWRDTKSLDLKRTHSA